MGRPPHTCLRCGSCCTMYPEKAGGMCKYLIRNQDGTTKCKIYERRPKECRDYPGDGACIKLMENNKW